MKQFRPGQTWVFKGRSRLKPTLIIVAAPSGGGKSTLCARLVQDYPEIMENVSFTTRPRRNQEEDGVDYFFIEKDEFEEKISRDFFIEYAKVHGDYYGVSQAQIETTLDSDRPVILDIDVQGAKTLTAKFPDALTVFVLPPSIEELERRLKARDKGQTRNYQIRLKNAVIEMEQAKNFKYQIVNDNLEEAYAKLKNIVETELRRD